MIMLEPTVAAAAAPRTCSDISDDTPPPTRRERAETIVTGSPLRAVRRAGASLGGRQWLGQSGAAIFTFCNFTPDLKIQLKNCIKRTLARMSTPGSVSV